MPEKLLLFHLASDNVQVHKPCILHSNTCIELILVSLFPRYVTLVHSVTCIAARISMACRRLAVAGLDRWREVDKTDF